MSKTFVFKVWVDSDDVIKAYDALNDVDGVIEIDFEDSYDE